MAEHDIREKAERIAALFRERHQIDILPAELMPADLDEAYAVRAVFEEIEVARGRGAVVGYKIGLTTPIMQQLCGVSEPVYGAIFAGEVHHGHAEFARCVTDFLASAAPAAACLPDPAGNLHPVAGQAVRASGTG